MNVLSGRILAVNEREAARYMGYMGGATPQGEVAALFEKCSAAALAAQSPKAVYEVYPLTFKEDGADLGFVFTRSRDLRKYLSGCSRVAVFAATLGAGIDRLVAAYSRLSASSAVVMQAIGSAMAEQWCDEVHAKLRSEYGGLSARFSPGFGDAPLAMQRDIFAALQVTKNTGVTLTEDCFMLPSKSVTAFVGIKQ